jgi:hypothetical protein
MSEITPLPGRLAGENELWYRRFCAYVTMGGRRSALEICNREREAEGRKRGVDVSGAWRDKPVKFSWVDRAAAWDKAEIERKANDLASEREAQRRRELEAAALLLKKGQEGVKLPLITATTKMPDGRVVEVKGDTAAVNTGIRALVESSNMARRALEMVGTRINVSQLTDAELIRLLDLTEPGVAGIGSAEAGDTSDTPANQDSQPG